MDVIAMSTRERKRLELMSRIAEGVLTLVAGARLASLSYRQMRRIWQRYQAEGDAGLIHRGRGRTSNRRLPAKLRQRVLARYVERYGDFGPTLACEYLEQEGLRVDHETLRRWLLQQGLWQKQRKRQQHRQWRERRAHRGELLQMDGSHHDWFEGRRDRAVLMVLIDDATNRTYARFYEAEDTRAALDSFGRYIRRYGLPHGLYVDQDSIYTCTRAARLDEELRGQGPQTQFARALQQLSVELILAYSPQAKGRVERQNGVLQDRLVKALRLAGIATLETANRFLDQDFLPALNRRFTVCAREAGDLHRSLPPGRPLKDILCWEEPRVVQNDWTVRWRNRFFQLAPRHAGLNLAGRTLVVRERLEGRVVLSYRGHLLDFRELDQRPSKPAPQRQITERKQSPPSADHPWRKALLRGGQLRCLQQAGGLTHQGTFLTS